MNDTEIILIKHKLSEMVLPRPFEVLDQNKITHYYINKNYCKECMYKDFSSVSFENLDPRAQDIMGYDKHDQITFASCHMTFSQSGGHCKGICEAYGIKEHHINDKFNQGE